MGEPDESNFNNIIRRIIKKSLFTERQIEIILNRRDLLSSEFPVSRGAYYRQVGQSREKLASFVYSLVLLHGLGVLLPEDMDVMMKISENVRVIYESDMFPEKEEEVMDMMDGVVRRACRM